jgi:hypothetical protein
MPQWFASLSNNLNREIVRACSDTILRGACLLQGNRIRCFLPCSRNEKAAGRRKQSRSSSEGYANPICQGRISANDPLPTSTSKKLFRRKAASEVCGFNALQAVQ